MADLSANISSQVKGVASGNFSSLASLGITLVNQAATATNPAVSNVLNVDDSALSSALTTKFQQVSSVFGFQLNSNNANLRVFSQDNTVTISDFTLTIDKDGVPPVFNVSYDLHDGNGTITKPLQVTELSGGLGYTFTGPANTGLAGLKLIYASTDAAIITVKATQGIADRVYNATDAVAKANTGTLAIAQTAIQTSNKRLNDDILQVNSQVAIYQQQLLKQFAALESTISQVNQLLTSLSANDNARFEASQ